MWCVLLSSLISFQVVYNLDKGEEAEDKGDERAEVTGMCSYIYVCSCVMHHVQYVICDMCIYCKQWIAGLELRMRL